MDEPSSPVTSELAQRVVYSLFRAATRVGIRLRLPLGQLESLLQMAYFQEARETHGLKLDAIAELFGRSLRTVSALHNRYRSNFFAPENEVALRRAIAAIVNHTPADRARLRLAFPDVSEAEIDAALVDLERAGTIIRRAELWHRNPDAHEFTGQELKARVDGLNRQMDVLTEAVWHRLVREDDAPALARTYVFHASEVDLRSLLQALETMARERAIAADRAWEQTGDGQKVGLTFAAAPLEEDG